MKKKLTSAENARDPDSRINKPSSLEERNLKMLNVVQNFVERFE